MSTGSPFSRVTLALALTLQLALTAPTTRADVVINEIVAAPSDRLLQWDSSNVPHLGTGTPWQSFGFNEAAWSSGAGPFGFGTFSGVTFGTNLSTAMLNLTPTIYLRKSFTVSAADATSSSQLVFSMAYNDGFVAYLNGVEIARQWAGPAKEFIYHDQPAYNPTAANTTNPTTQYTYSVNLGAANTLLTQGTNLLTIQALNWAATSTNFLVSPTLNLAGGTVLAAPTDTYKYFVGTVEPSGNLYDPALLSSGRLNVAWGTTAFDDSTWGTGVGPLRAGTTGAGTVVSGVIGVTPSLYARSVFTATAAQVADTKPLQLLVDYDDGFVAYVNGVEVARANVGTANTFTPYNAVATATHNNSGNGTQTTFSIDAPAAVLKAGNNVLSIQVHNVAINDADLYVKADLKTNAGVSLASGTGTFRYFVGTAEPVASTNGNVEESPDGPDSEADWIELYNNGTSAVSLSGWTLTDSTKDTKQWTFPASATIAAGGYLVVFCDGLNITAPGAGGYLHTNFKLGAAGEYLGLYNAAGTVVQNFLPAFPPARPFYSYGRTSGGAYAYFDTATPGAANTVGSAFSGLVADPVVGLAGGFYSGTTSVTLTDATPGASIYYTYDGSEPTTSSNLYVNTLSLVSSTSLRVKAFAAGLVPSNVVTNTYLINASASQKSLPAICITADQGRSLYRPFGVMAIYNNASGNYSGSLWTANGDPTQYNNLTVNGESLERPAYMELIYAPGTAPTGYGNVRNGVGLRSSGSDYTFPRYVLTVQNGSSPNAGTWTNTSTEKPSFNLFFRSELGDSPLVAPLFPLSPVTSFHDLRFRAGHNDPNPFVIDELQRRLFLDMGQVGSAGILTTFWIEGVYKGFYNLCEHLRDDFFQQAYHSTADWDVRQVTSIGSGDGISFQEMITYIQKLGTNGMATLANYQGMQTRLDMVNFSDYLLTYAYGAGQDWPLNNYVASHERTSTGIHRFHVWDAEFSYGLTQGNGVYSNSFQSGTNGGTGGYIAVPIVTSTPTTDSIAGAIRILYTLLKQSPEFRLQFADRIQKHMYNGGALTDSRVLARWTELKNQITPLQSPSDVVTTWVNGVTTGLTVTTPSRRQVLLGYTNSSGTAVTGHLIAEGLWPATLAPTVNQFGGTVASGFQATMANPNSAGTIYYTVDGSDPRAQGGAARGTAYTTALTITQTTALKARVLNPSGEWSPLIDPIFRVTTPPALQITELMYHPPLTGTNTVENEFIELKNTGSTAINLSGMNFTSGITYTFPAGSSLGAGSFAVLVKDQAQFTARYPGVPVSGVFTDSLSNSGETVTLADVTGTAIYSVTYSSTSPWPTLPDGYGNSLVPVSANANPDPNTAANWRASAALGGSPSADDPTPTIPAVVVNEVLSNSGDGASDQVELYNPTSSAADISYWYLSDSSTTPKKFQVPAGTILPAGGYKVYTEADFNPVTPVGSNVSFAFDSNGEQVRLTSADSAGNLTGYSDGFTFGAADAGVSFGRYVNSVGAVSYPAQKAQTFGSANAGPLIGPLVITELMYAPPTGSDEFMEIRNISGQTVQLYDTANPANTWKVDGVGFTFPTGTTIGPGQIILVTPLTETAWRAKYPSTPAAVKVYGAYTGKQDNSGEKLSLQHPGVPYLNSSNVTTIPYIDVDYVNYLPTSPWPTGAVTTGYSIERKVPTAFGDDPGNWRLSPTLGGTPGALATFNYTAWNSLYFTSAQLADSTISGPTADPDGDGISNLLEYAFGLNPLGYNGLPYSVSLANDGANGPYVTLTFRRSTSTSGLTYFGDVSGSLAGAWTLGGAVQVGTAVNNGDGTETVVLRDTVVSTGANQRFIRLRVTSN